MTRPFAGRGFIMASLTGVGRLCVIETCRSKVARGMTVIARRVGANVIRRLSHGTGIIVTLLTQLRCAQELVTDVTGTALGVRVHSGKRKASHEMIELPGFLSRALLRKGQKQHRTQDERGVS